MDNVAIGHFALVDPVRAADGSTAIQTVATATAQGGPFVAELFSPFLGARLWCGVLQDLADLRADFDGRKLAEALEATRTCSSDAQLPDAGRGMRLLVSGRLRLFPPLRLRWGEPSP